MIRERLVDDRPFGEQKVQNGSVVLHQVDKEANGLFEHGGTQFVVEARKSVSIDGCCVLRNAESRANYPRTLLPSLGCDHLATCVAFVEPRRSGRVDRHSLRVVAVLVGKA